MIKIKFMRKFTVFLFIAVLSFQGNVFALTVEQKRIIDSNVFYFNIEQSRGTCTGGVSLIGSENAEKVWHFLIGKGLQPHQVAGVLGNMQAESGIEPRLVQYGKLNTRGEVSKPGEPSSLDDTPPPGEKTGYGIVQFTPGTKILPAAQRLNMQPGDLGFQLTLLWEQLNGESEIPEKAAGDHLKATTTVEDASRSFEYKYERHATDPEQEQIRIAFSRDFLARYGSDTSGSFASGGTACGNGQLSGGYSLPVDRKIYDDNPEYFTKPHHDYPAADIPLPVGTNVYSMTSGTIISAPTNGDCGIGVSIEASDGIVFIYCHGSDGGSVTGAKKGDKVVAGQLIMHSANTGNSSGPHLHLGITVNNTRVCPQTLFVGIADGSPPEVSTLPSSGCTN